MPLNLVTFAAKLILCSLIFRFFSQISWYYFNCRANPSLIFRVGINFLICDKAFLKDICWCSIKKAAKIVAEAELPWKQYTSRGSLQLIECLMKLVACEKCLQILAWGSSATFRHRYVKRSGYMGYMGSDVTWIMCLISSSRRRSKFWAALMSPR